MNVTDNQKGCILHGPKVDLEGVSMSADSETVELITERMYPVPPHAEGDTRRHEGSLRGGRG